MGDADIKSGTFLASEPGFFLRKADWADLEAITQLIYDTCEADGDTTVAVTSAELKNEWKTDGFILEEDAIVAETREGRIVGFEQFTNEKHHYHLNTDGYVHPQFKGWGIGTALLKKIGDRAQKEVVLAPPGTRVFIRSTIDNQDQAAHDLHRLQGFFPIRYHWRMEVKLNQAPQPPIFPSGIELRPFVRNEHSVAVWQAENEAFQDHWGSHDVAYTDWVHRKLERPGFDPSLWVIAWDGDQVAGFSLNRFRMQIGWIGTLGVRRPWRNKGLGLALLQHSFREFYRRDMKTIGLGVDASNPTGATRLYQKAGMVVASEFATYEKELRPGISNDS